MQKVYLISEKGAHLRNLPKLFNPSQYALIFIGGNNSIFKKNKSFIKIGIAKNRSFIESFIENGDLLDSINGLVIFGTDSEMREIAESDLPINLKLILLPSKSPNFLDMYDSKAGFDRISDMLKLKKPRTIVVRNLSELKAAISELNFPIFLKKDRGGGGTGVTQFQSVEGIFALNITSADLPILLQEKMSGDLVGVEAFYLNGHLLAYIYSKAVNEMSSDGPTYEHISMVPNSTDFVAALESIGRLTELTGLVNCTFILDSRSGEHFIFEFDPRPNTWHFLANSVGLDISNLYSSQNINTQESNVGIVNFVLTGRYIHYLSNYAVKRKALSGMISMSKSSSILIGKNGSLTKNRFIKFLLLNFKYLSRKPFYVAPRELQRLIRHYL